MPFLKTDSEAPIMNRPEEIPQRLTLRPPTCLTRALLRDAYPSTLYPEICSPQDAYQRAAAEIVRQRQSTSPFHGSCGHDISNAQLTVLVGWLLACPGVDQSRLQNALDRATT